MLTRTEGLAVRRARPGDAEHLARLADMAGEGLPSHFWATIAEPGEDALAAGVRRAAGEESAFSWRRATVAEIAGDVAGALVSYRIGETPEPLDGLPPIFRPLQALENRAPGTLYVNVLATYPAFRRRGVGRRLLGEAERQAAGTAMSLIVADANHPARRLYEAAGFAEAARAPIATEPGWAPESREWVLMLRPPGIAGL